MTTYSLPDPETFMHTVWHIVREVPSGQVTTYGQIASMIPPPDDIEPEAYNRLAPRWVGDAMNAVSSVDDPNVPWHRVINSKGGISLPEGSRSALLQRQRLEAEGVKFNRKDTCNLDEVGWDGPDDDWLRQHNLLTPRSIKSKPDTGGQLPLF